MEFQRSINLGYFYHLCHFWSLRAFDDDLVCCGCTVTSMHRRITACQGHRVGIDISAHPSPAIQTATIGSVSAWVSIKDSVRIVSSLAQRLACPSRVTTYHNCSSVWMHASPHCIPAVHSLPTHRARPTALGFPPYSPQPSARWASQPSLHGSPKIGRDCVSEHLPLPDSCNSYDSPLPCLPCEKNLNCALH